MNENSPLVLIVDDEPSIVEVVSYALHEAAPTTEAPSPASKCRYSLKFTPENCPSARHSSRIWKNLMGPSPYDPEKRPLGLPALPSLL